MEITKHPRFRWMAGMLTTTGRRVLATYLRYEDEPGSTYITSVGADTSTFLPISSVSVETFVREYGSLDLTDAATVGCLQSILLAELPEAESLGVNGHRVTFWDGREHCNESKTGANLGEALCAALLTVWGEK